MSVLRFDDITESFRKLRRFPLETAISAALALFCILSIHLEFPEEWALGVIQSLIVTFFLSTGASLYRESRKKTKKPGRALAWLSSGIPLAYGLGFYFVNDYLGSGNPESVAFFLLHLAGFVAILFFAPYSDDFAMKKSEGRDAVEYSNYLALVAWTVLMAVIVGGSASALGFIAIGSVVTLFDLENAFRVEKAFMTWASVTLALIAPLYGLIQFPEPSKMKRDGYEANRFFSFLVRFVGIPAIFVFFVILYAYSVRVLANFQDWPKGMVSWMVIGFSSFGYLVYAFSKPYEEGSRLISAFRKLFPFAVLPQILMLFYAIYLRIAQYDVTMNRYFVVIFGAWLTAVSLYFALSKAKSLVLLPASLALFSLLVSFGPWSVFSMPLERQYDRLISHLEQVGALKDGKPVRISAAIDPKLESSIVSEIDYVCEYRNCAKLRPLFSKTLEDAEKARVANQNGNPGTSELSSWEAANAIKTELNVRMRYDEETTGKYVQIAGSARKGQYPIAVTGYDLVAEVA